MAGTIERLRRWILLGTLVLALAVVGFIGYARYRARHFMADLPHKLGVDIKSETNGYTYSQSVKGRTLFTIHASKAIQRQDGKTTLHDVSITLYGGAGTSRSQDRTDHISGSEFEYDQPNGVVRAMGEVHIDLESPAATSAAHPAKDAGPEKQAEGVQQKDGRIHVKTSGLVFMQKLGVATTEQPIEFYLNEVQGEATGAEYDSGTGVLILRKDVRMRREEKGKTSTLAAGYAEIDRTQHVARLRDAHYRSGDEGISGNQLNVDMEEDGSPSSLHAVGNVVIEDGLDTKITAQRADAVLDSNRKPKIVHLLGGVQIAGNSSNGHAQEAELHFDAAGHPQVAHLIGDAHFVQTVPQQQRELTAGRIEITLVRGQDGHTIAQKVHAVGSARIHVQSAVQVKGATATTVLADSLVGTFSSQDGAQYLDHITGMGHSALEQTLADGTTRRSRSDSLDVVLRPPAKKGVVGKATTTDTVQSAVQQGAVVIDNRTPADAVRHRAVTEMHAVAQRAAYDGLSEEVTLTGAPHVEGDGTYLSAAKIVMSRTSGDATADGDVRASYDNGSPRGVMHVLAQHAEIHRSQDMAIFSGDVMQVARLWQGSSQLEAPKIEMDRAHQILRAHSDKGHSVRLALANEQTVIATPQATAKPQTAVNKTQRGTGVARANGVLRVAGTEFVYNGAGTVPVAHITGDVQVEQAGGKMRSDRLTATWQPRTPAVRKTTASNDLLGGALDTLVAEGNVRIDQPGRSGTGEYLLYTAATGEYELTGSVAAPPRILDASQGSITGASLIFHSGDDSVVIVAAPGKRVHAETRIRR